MVFDQVTSLYFRQSSLLPPPLCCIGIIQRFSVNFHFFGQNLKLMTTGEVRDSASLPSGSAPSSPITADATPVCLAISRSHVNLTHEQNPEILELLHLGQQLTLNTEGSNPMFPAGNLGLRLGGADSQPSRFVVC